VKYRKRPVVIDAVTWYGKYSGRGEWPEWFNVAIEKGNMVVQDDGALTIRTLEGIMRAEKGDKVIQGVKAEIYPCKSDIFDASYEPA
jgi:hypothetical protein